MLTLDVKARSIGSSRAIVLSVLLGLGLVIPIACSGGGSSGGGGGGTTSSGQAAVFVKDGPPVPLADGRVMQQLFLRVTQVTLRDPGPRVTVPLAAPFVDFDLIALDTTSKLLAIGPVPPGVYEHLTFTVDPQACHFIDTNGVLQQLTVPSSTFEVDFQPPIDTRVSSTIILDIRPDRVVQVVTAGTTYQLVDDVDAFVAGPPGAPGIPANVGVDEIEGVVTAVNCPRVVINNLISVDTSNARIFESDTLTQLACSDITPGTVIEVDGALRLVNGRPTIAATDVEVEDPITGGAANEVEIEGTIANLQVGGTAFDLARAGVVVARVTLQAGAQVDDEPTDTRITPADLREGDSVKVEGRANGAGVPITFSAREVKRF